MLEGQRSYIDRVLEEPQGKQCMPGTKAGQVSPTHPSLNLQSETFLPEFSGRFFFFFFTSD